MVAPGKPPSICRRGLTLKLLGCLSVLGAELTATRKVTDQGWLPRSKQVGITGHSIAPALNVVIGASGKFNHMVGSQASGLILVINSDPAAPVFDWADIGIVPTGEKRCRCSPGCCPVRCGPETDLQRSA